MLDRDRSIAAQNAANVAATIYASLGATSFDPEVFESIRRAVFNGTLILCAVDAPQPAPAPTPRPAPTPAPQPQPISVATGGNGHAQQAAATQVAEHFDAYVDNVVCPKCNGETWDNRQDNVRRRQGGYKLGADFKCRDKACQGVIWPSDYRDHKTKPQEPRP